MNATSLISITCTIIHSISTFILIFFANKCMFSISTSDALYDHIEKAIVLRFSNQQKIELRSLYKKIQTYKK